MNLIRSIKRFFVKDTIKRIVLKEVRGKKETILFMYEFPVAIKVSRGYETLLYVEPECKTDIEVISI